MTVYYVSSSSGSNSNNGTPASTPFATLQQAANVTKPGDTVEVMSGTYTSPGSYDVLDIRTSGMAGAPITYEAAPGQTPVIDNSGNSVGIVDEGASYITVKGFTVVGDAASITLSQAESELGSSATTEKGIALWGIPQIPRLFPRM